MSSWSRHRRLTYGVIVIFILLVAVFVPAFFFFYKAPTCFDGSKNGNETGTDCGGSCERLCASAKRPLITSWTDFDEVTPGLYNLATYIVNPNPSGKAAAVPYRLTVYDNKGMEITELNGTVDIPPNRNTLAFMPAISFGKSIPYRILFEFSSPPVWVKGEDTLGMLQVTDKNYTEDDTGSSLEVTLKNPSARPIGRLTVYVALYDKDGNVIGFSKTLVDSVPATGTAVAPFTWSTNRHGRVVSIEVLPVAQ